MFAGSKKKKLIICEIVKKVLILHPVIPPRLIKEKELYPSAQRI